MKPRIFIGSSVESLEIAYSIQNNLDYDGEITVWSQGVFLLSSNALDDLIRASANFDFGIFVFSPEDIIRIREQQFLSTRDNVVFELGLFIGKLSKARTFIVIPRGHQDFHLPTDLAGVTPATFNPQRADENLQAALAPACNEIRKVIRKLGRIDSSQREAQASADQLHKVLLRVIELQQANFSDIKINDWKLIHSIDEKGNSHLHEELTLVPSTGPFYFYLLENNIADSVDKNSSIKISAKNLMVGVPLTVLETLRTDKSVSYAIMLDPPSTVEKPQRISIDCERAALWRDLIETGKDEGIFRSSNESDFLHMEFLAPPGKRWSGFTPTPQVGDVQVEASTDKSRIIWSIPNPPARRFSYKLFLE